MERYAPPPAFFVTELPEIRPFPPSLTRIPLPPHPSMSLAVTSGSDSDSMVTPGPSTPLIWFSLTKPRAYVHSRIPPPPPRISFLRNVSCEMVGDSLAYTNGKCRQMTSKVRPMHAEAHYLLK